MFIDSDPFEHLHIKFIKEILGVQCETTNVALVAETNRTPLYLKKSAIKFINHIVKSPNSFFYKIYNNVEKTSKWVNIIKDWLNKLGFGHLTFDTINLKYYINTIQQSIFDQVYQIMNCSIHKCEKSNFFCKTKKNWKKAPRYDICKFKTDRSVFRKFKLIAIPWQLKGIVILTSREVNALAYPVTDKKWRMILKTLTVTLMIFFFL